MQLGKILQKFIYWIRPRNIYLIIGFEDKRGQTLNQKWRREEKKPFRQFCPHRWGGGGGNKNLAPGLNPRNKLFNVKKIGINLSFKAVWPDPRIKYCPIFPNSCPNSRHSSLTYKVTFFKIAQKVAKSLCYSGKRICHREISKIAQTGHTASQVHVRSRSEWIIKIRYLAMLMWIIIGVVVVVMRMMWLTRLRWMVS